MKYFAQINSDNLVLNILSVADNKNEDWLESRFGHSWVLFSDGEMGNLTTNNAAKIGWFYQAEKASFVPPKPYESWIYNEDLEVWEAPVSYPIDGNLYQWNEELKQWDLSTE